MLSSGLCRVLCVPAGLHHAWLATWLALAPPHQPWSIQSARPVSLRSQLRRAAVVPPSSQTHLASVSTISSTTLRALLKDRRLMTSLPTTTLLQKRCASTLRSQLSRPPGGLKHQQRRSVDGEIAVGTVLFDMLAFIYPAMPVGHDCT